MVKATTLDLPYKEIKLVTHPIEVSSIRRRNGSLIQVIKAAADLEPTSVETGLAPHLEWPVETPKEVNIKVGGLRAAIRRLARSEKRYAKISVMQRSNSDTADYRIYIWNQE